MESKNTIQTCRFPEISQMSYLQSPMQGQQRLVAHRISFGIDKQELLVRDQLSFGGTLDLSRLTALSDAACGSNFDCQTQEVEESMQSPIKYQNLSLNPKFDKCKPVLNARATTGQGVDNQNKQSYEDELEEMQQLGRDEFDIECGFLKLLPQALTMTQMQSEQINCSCLGW